MAKLYYQGHGSFRITTDDGRVIYVDPFAGDGYNLPADFILVSHQHGDHNQIQLPAKKPDCRIITNAEALAGGRYQSFSFDGIEIEAVEAYNVNHKAEECVGFIITVDGVKVYASGDTGITKQMETFAAIQFDYALFPCDGIYNMDLEEVTKAMELVGAKHNIPIHSSPGELFDRVRVEKIKAPNIMIVEPGVEIKLVKSE